MTDFLRRLAPVREGDATRAVAALPSQFERLTPLRVAPTVPPVLREGAESAPLENRNTGDAQAAALARADHRSEAQRAVPEHPAIARPTIGAPPGDTSDHAEATAALRIGAIGPRSLSSRQRFEREAAGMSAHILSRAAPGAAVSPLALVSSASQSLAAQETHRVVAQPLSDSALAARVNHTAGEPPVIHVTIDRIDVHAPAPRERAAAPSPRQAAKPSISLTDYLRARASPRHGGEA